jgi:excisionase family DNA binding protein
MYKLKEIREILRISPSFVDKMIKEGKINIVWFGRTRRVSEEELERIKKEGIR